VSEAIVIVKSVEARKTQSGKTLFVLTDDTGREYTTFKEPIAQQAIAAEGKRAQIHFHETQKGTFTNVYLDSVEPLAGGEVAWRTAIDAAPYILSGDAVEKEVPPEEFFEKLKPLKDLVADDIRSEDDGDAGLDDDADEQSR
jgi:hypothetical protein